MAERRNRDSVRSHEGVGNVSLSEDQWIAIQHKTFANWVNEQLTISGRSVENLATDFCDGVKLVALIESLQFRKIGKVYTKPTSKIQMLQNVGLAFKAIADDNIRLVNIGNEDVVNGNLKLILGLLWHLILRYQISSSKTKAPPKKLMIAWFRSVLPEVKIDNFTTDWTDGIALHALLDFCKPGTSPDWRKLHSKNGVENCRQAMKLAKEHLHVPRVISPEDFASSALDELSAMTYLSYFIKKDSPGYYSTLNWVCRQLRNTTISNLSTDWNDGYYLCAIVQSLGGEVPGWPNIDRNNHVETCQKGIDSAKSLGVDPILTASELADPSVDHLAVMAYIGKFQKVTPRKGKAEKLVMSCSLSRVKEGTQTSFSLDIVDIDVSQAKTKIDIRGPSTQPNCDFVWRDKKAQCSFTPMESGEHVIHVAYDGVEINGSPIYFTVVPDVSRVQLLTTSGDCPVGDVREIKVDQSRVSQGEVKMEMTSPGGAVSALACSKINGTTSATFHPRSVGEWQVAVWFEEEVVEGSPVVIKAFDSQKAWVTGPQRSIVGEPATFIVNCKDAGSEDITAEVIGPSGIAVSNADVFSGGETQHVKFTPERSGCYVAHIRLKGSEIRGSPAEMEILDPGQIVVFGDGLERGTKGEETRFEVETRGIGGHVDVEIEAPRVRKISYNRTSITPGTYQFRYIPTVAGQYSVSVLWNGRHLKGSPFSPGIIDRSGVTLMDDLTDLKDENDYLVLECDQETKLHFDVSKAGPGNFSGEVLGPSGKLPVHVDQNQDVAEFSFTAKQEGEHYIHLYWSDGAVESSPILANCAGPKLPIDHTKVFISGKGTEEARATMMAEFIIDGRKAGPGVPRVKLQGVKTNLDVDIHPMKYDRYRCTYTSLSPGGFLLYVYWSDVLVPGCPHKVTVTTKGDVQKVKVTGEGLKGGIAGQELKVFVDTRDAGPGEVTAIAMGRRHGARCDVIENRSGEYTVIVFPTEAEKHLLQIKYDGQHAAESPFVLKIGEPPDATKVKVFGPGIEDGLIQTYESRFLVETYGAGAGQLAVKIRGPRGGFRVDMRREGEGDRTILCRFDPTEPGQYFINVRWSGVSVPGSPFEVNIFETREDYDQFLRDTGRAPIPVDTQWRAEI